MMKLEAYRRMFAAAELDTGVVVSWTDTILPAIMGRRIITHEVQFEGLGFLFFNKVVEPDTHNHIWIERMLWVSPESRSCGIAKQLVARWEEDARLEGVHSLSAGSSLGYAATPKVYADRNFTTTQSFRKVLTYV